VKRNWTRKEDKIWTWPNKVFMVLYSCFAAVVFYLLFTGRI